MKRFALPVVLLLPLVLIACAASQVNAIQSTPAFVTATLIMPSPVNDSAIQVTPVPENKGNDDMTRTDEQGVVMFAVTPLNLDAPADTLEFNVSMNTHSIDLSMNLAELGTLSTDTGVTVQATIWDATPGGHHVGGTLIFPRIQNGKSILEGASTLTMTIVNVDAASRVFEWDLK
jgi:hypothetical protein